VQSDGKVFQQQRLAPSTAGIDGSGSLIPTPTACDGKGSGMSAFTRGHQQNLRDWFRMNHGFLYPPVRAVEYLMAWPIGWTDLEPLAMDKYQQWYDAHGSC